MIDVFGFRFDGRFQHVDARITVVGVEHSDTRDVVAEFQGVIGVLAVECGQRAGRLHQFHLTFELLLRKRLVPGNLDLLNANLGAFIDVKGQSHGACCQFFLGEFDRGVLMTLFRKQYFD